MPRKIESHFVPGAAGRLEALLEEPEDREPVEAALVCHPHPQHGGTMHNKVVYRTARALRKRGAVVLRFNYRGVNLSEGSYAGGKGELEDARMALAWLRQQYPGLPYSLAGFSFGSRIILQLGCELGDPKRLIALGFPASYRDRIDLSDCAVPKYFVQSTNDQYGRKEDLESYVATLPQPKLLLFVEARDHFFAGALNALEQTLMTEVP